MVENIGKANNADLKCKLLLRCTRADSDNSAGAQTLTRGFSIRHKLRISQHSGRCTSNKPVLIIIYIYIYIYIYPDNTCVLRAHVIYEMPGYNIVRLKTAISLTRACVRACAYACVLPRDFSYFFSRVFVCMHMLFTHYARARDLVQTHESQCEFAGSRACLVLMPASACCDH
jgi:hypothetical protein